VQSGSVLSQGARSEIVRDILGHVGFRRDLEFLRPIWKRPLSNWSVISKSLPRLEGKSIFLSVRVPMNFGAVLICTCCLAILSPPMYAQAPVTPYGCPVQLDDIDAAPILLHDVKFDGEITLSDADRENFVSSLKRAPLFAFPQWIDAITADAERLWLEHGYSQVILVPEARTFSVDAEGEHVFLTFHVKEGPKRWLKQVSFRLKNSALRDPETAASESRTPKIKISPINHSVAAMSPDPASVFPMERLRKLIPLQDGDIFNTIKIYEGLDAVENLYSSEGYADFSIMQVIALNDQDLSATVTLELDEGKQFHVGQVMGLGVDASLAESLQTALPSGDIFRPAAVDAVLKSVFPDAPANRIRLSKHTGEAKVDITVDLRPCPPVERSVQE
jgi:hypothetical protein